MNYLKTILVIVGLLGIGFLGGFYTHRAITIDKINRVAKLRERGGFAKHLINRLQPTPDQKEQLKPIIDQYAVEISAIHKGCKSKRIVLLDSLGMKMQPILSEEQMHNFKEFTKRYKRVRKKKNGKTVKVKQQG